MHRAEHPVVRVALALAALWLAGCQSLPSEPPAPLAVPPVRFLLTFDDGPSVSEGFNPTLAVHAALARNRVQPEIKALFFVQTRNTNGGGTERGRAILRQTHAAGHVLGLHSCSVRGHVRHTKMTPEELDTCLADGKSDLRGITEADPLFLRPPYWGRTEATHLRYAANGLHMLLTDINSRDGVTHFYNHGWTMRNHLRDELVRVRERLARNELPSLNGATPLVVTFHDINRWTGENLAGYLEMLVEEAAGLGIPLSERPYYDQGREIISAAHLRAVPYPVTVVAQP